MRNALSRFAAWRLTEPHRIGTHTATDHTTTIITARLDYLLVYTIGVRSECLSTTVCAHVCNGVSMCSVYAVRCDRRRGFTVEVLSEFHPNTTKCTVTTYTIHKNRWPLTPLLPDIWYAECTHCTHRHRHWAKTKNQKKDVRGGQWYISLDFLFDQQTVAASTAVNNDDRQK